MNDYDAFTGGQSAGLDDDRHSCRMDEGDGLGSFGENLKRCGGNMIFSHKFFGKGLGAFDFGGQLRGAENSQSVFFEFIDNAQCQGDFRTDHGQINVVFFRKIGQSFDIVGFYINRIGE